MAEQAGIDEKYKQVGNVIAAAGGTPVPVNDTLVKLLKYFLNEEDLDFVLAFNEQKSQTVEQLRQSTGLCDSEIVKKANILASRGVIFNQPNRSGVMVYRLLPLINVGTFEYMFMGKVENNEKNRRISALFDQLFKELDEIVQGSYDELMPHLMKAPPVDRTVPVVENKSTGKPVKIIVDESVDESADRILPTQEAAEIIEKFDDIALGYCFCRHHKDLSGHPCKQTDLRETCFTFGKSARYTSEQGFSRMISKQEALEILKKSEADGLVHKAYHPNFDVSKEETSICNCCRCCCGNSVDNMIAPVTNATNFISVIDPDLCVGCGICVDLCHTYAAFLGDDGKARRKEQLCIGCGVCAANCPENAISLVKGPLRIVRIPPRRKKT
jgi:ferredoxin